MGSVSGGRLSGRTAIVTGGALGIGRAISELFAREGARVAIADLAEAEGTALADDITSRGGVARFWPLDVSDERLVAEVFSAISEAFGPAGVLVNNAGVGGPRRPAHELTAEDWEPVYRVNVMGVANCTRQAVTQMLSSGGGSIVNIASVLGVVGGADNTPYVSSKAAVRLMTKSDALTYASAGIRVNSISPGFVWTPLIERYVNSTANPGAARSSLASLHPVGRLGEPMEVAYGALYLASDESSFTTGADLVIDGGYTAR